MPTIAEMLAQAKAFHAARDLGSAVRLYQQVIQADPAHVEAHFLLAAACYGLGRVNESITSLAQAIRLQPDYAEAHNHLGAVLAQQGKLDEAISSFQQACRLRPASVEMAANLRHALAAKDNKLGAALAAQGKLDEAVASFRHALELEPGDAETHNTLGAVLGQQAKLAEATASFRRALELKPDYANAYNNLGAVLGRQEKLDESLACFRRAVELNPDYTDAHYNLGVVWAKQGNLDEAAICHRRALELKPELVAARHALAVVLRDQNKLDEAAACCRRVLELKPDYAEAHANLGAILGMQRKHDEAVVHLRRALELKPDYAEAHGNAGAVLAKQGKHDEAIVHFRRALALKPDFAEVYNEIGILLGKQGSLDEAAACCRRARELKPGYDEAHNSLGVALSRQAKTDEALACFRKALEIQPGLAGAHSNILFTLHYQPRVTLAQLALEHREYDERHAAPLRGLWRPHDNERNPQRRLRLGFVSADFGFHPVGYFLARVLENLDNRQVETTCYCDRPTSDAMTARLRAAATDWRDVLTLDDQQLADQIRADHIDILFDLAGHTAGNRLLAFARKPAPIQITWLGYVGTTGLEAMDYLLADRYEVPESAEPLVRERVLRMPDGYVCYDPPANAPAVSPLPAFERGYVTFGSFNNLAKINPDVVDVWARILRQVAFSRLTIKYRGLDAPSVTHRIVEMFAQRGVDRGRLELLGGSSHPDLLRQYQGLDIALDPFPYNGGLTTCEALWMGVPVITCPGETFASRHSLSHLSNVGLTETIAGDLDEYVDLAAGLAADLQRLAALRARLRDQVAGSPLCDGQRFAENFTQVLRGAWRQWCDKQPAR